ncbi:type III-B CRISPR module-associated protein Cmr5 [uncultured Thiodictyon sp.]|uniref:type III-B CRISPR module-associated protein Cmr5 n=1 Tax=uncultured Thiodictyon sp. TaxID=1846217 RepID=UPI0025E27717|nr:type III-B CRISPR module-associated protein Cmr5 [uncultured Thiodictyon sp.]
MTLKTLEQVRMKRAYAAIDDTQGARRTTWLQAVSGFGPEIQRSGLLQALAFLHRGPTKDIADDLCKQIREHLTKLGHLPAPKRVTSFLIEVRDLDRATYMRVTREIMALSVWLKRAGQILGDDKE